MFIKKILFFLLITSVGLKSQTELFPSHLNIQPFAANMLEPKVGFLFQNHNSELRLDIGNSLEVLQITNGSSVYSFGADLFTYTLLRKEDNFHFPVDAVDYLFGINFGYKVNMGESSYGMRARISHISAHFADGHFDNVRHSWLNGLNPRVYSREFIELMPFYKYKSARFYAGFTYLFHVDPNYIKRDLYQAGFDYFREDLIAKSISPFLGYDFKLTTTTTHNSNHSLSIGIKFGKAFGRGVSVYYNYFNGNNIHGEYFDFKQEYSAFGINLDL